ncbi:MAG: GTPase HflX [Anaerolineales bacterium]|nr:GTPase HflX [Anaerolineales bacterium]
MSKPSLPTQLPKERAFLIGVDLAGNQSQLSMEDSLIELALLADTAGLSVVGQATQKLKHPDPKTFLRSGKVQEVRHLVEETLADIVLFDDELSPRHQRELEKIFGDDVRILDRSALILDIFAQHASTREGALQVELAQYEYLLPRLTRAWTHLARQAGGGGGRAGSVGGVGLRGPGETQLEVDRRVIGARISKLKSELEKVRQHRSQYRSRRRKAEIPTIALVGYTNAGKSTLINKLSGSDVYVADQLFATLDPTTRRIELPGGHSVLITDTVGFIQKLPATLVAAFRATLEEIAEADLLLHVVDISHPNALSHAVVVRDTLEEIHARELPVVTAMNKIDLLSDGDIPAGLLDEFDRAVPISARTGEGIPILLSVAEEELYERFEALTVRLPYQEGKLISMFHEQGVIEKIEHMDSSVLIKGRVPMHLAPEYDAFSQDVPSSDQSFES